VVDIACGKGTSAIYLAERYGCEVVGIDISEDLVAQATTLAKKKGLEGKVTFRVGDALQLPFVDNEFDAVVSQAMLVLVRDKRQSIQEALRVVKPDGYLGWLELSWKKQPTAEFLDAVSNVLCAYCMQNVHTFHGWESLFKDTGVNQLGIMPFSLENSGMLGMLAVEGLINSSKIMFRYVTNARIRKRMNTMNKFFKDHSDYFGYAIFTGRK
jgi:SAM-dependent methyltransferase